MTNAFKEEAEQILNHLIMTHDHSVTITHQHNVIPVQQALSDLEHLHDAEVAKLPQPSGESCYNCGNKTFKYDDAYRCIYCGRYTEGDGYEYRT